MIPSPNLDDRTFQDLVEEAKRLIPQYCPEWTNFNPSDPGITLIELYAWMTELMLYRLNKVPEKNFLAFLDLMGVRLEAPKAAETVVQFHPKPTAGTVDIPMGTGLMTRAEGGARPIPFETTEERTVVNTAINAVVSQVREPREGRTLIEDVTAVANGEVAGEFNPFQGTRIVDRFLYLGDDRLANFGEDALLSVSVERHGEYQRSFGQMLEWEYFDGQTWRALQQSQRGPREEVEVFDGPPSIQPTQIDGVETHWVRARLSENPMDAAETTINTVRCKLEVLGDGMTPDRLLANVVDDIYLNRDPDKHFLPFDREPRIDTTFYVRCDAILSQEGNIIRLELDLAEPSFAEPPSPSSDLVIRWEFFNGKKWMLLGKTTSEGVSEKSPGRYGLMDGTGAFSRSGVLEFSRPSTLTETHVNGESGYWIRARIEKGDYGVPGAYENVDDKWVWQDERPLRPPVLKRIALKSTEEPTPFQAVRTYNDWCYEDETARAALEAQEFQAFRPVPEESPTLFIGLTDKFPEMETQVYVRLKEDLDIGTEDETRAQSVVWEFWDGKEWQSLLPRDETQGLTRSGFVRFKGPRSLFRDERFGKDLFWLRARLEMGGFDRTPEIQRILLNAVPVRNATTFRGTTLGTSEGTPHQSFSFPRGPVLDGQILVVEENDEPTPAERESLEEEFGPGAVIESEQNPGKWLVRWKEVSDLHSSEARARHYVKDIVSGEVSFGDGIHGMIPPKGKQNIQVAAYSVGGGAMGNVKADWITVLKQSFSFIDSVQNPFPASGGCDMESVEQLKRRGPFHLKSRNRAVTAEDFEWLAMEASNTVARVRALAHPRRVGEVSVIVVPRGNETRDDELSEKLIPTPELLRRVAKYLDERRLLTTIVNVIRPRYVDVSVSLRIVRGSAGPGDRIKREIVQNLRRFLHPLRGGRDGKGWSFGRGVFKVDLYHLVEEVNGVELVDSVTLHHLERNVEADQIRLDEDQLVHLVDVTITEVSPEMGM